MKHLILFSLIIFLYFSGTTQTSTMSWVLLSNGTPDSLCSSSSNCDSNIVCYGLQYTPFATGAIEDYTTGFFANCSRLGSPVVFNSTLLGRTDHSDEVNDCEGIGRVLFNCSITSGGIFVSQGVPVILHKVCFQIPAGGEVIIEGDEILRRSLGFYVNSEEPRITDYAEYETQTISAACSSPDGLLSFDLNKKNNGHIDVKWTIAGGSSIEHFNIQRASDNFDFYTIANEEPKGNTSRDKKYKYTDRNPLLSDDYYRLQIFYSNGDISCSSAEKVPVDNQALASQLPNPSGKIIEEDITIIPNPVGYGNDMLIFGLKANENYELKVYSMTGQLMSEKSQFGSSDAFLSTQKLIHGTYIVTINSASGINIFKMYVVN